MKLLKVDTLQEARNKLLAASGSKIPKTEKVSFRQMRDRVLAEDLQAAENIPHFRRSTVDGYAVKASDTQGVSESIPVFLDDSETILVGLPGHPAAALIVFELMIGWLYRRLTGQNDPVQTTAEISENVAAAGGKTTCLLVEIKENDKAVPIFGKSGLMTTLTRADGYVVIDTDKEGLKAGETVKVTLF